MREKPQYNEEKNGSYVAYFTAAIKNMMNDGHKLPAVKKVTGSSKKCQVTAHLHIWDALQGYWERNKRTYTHRAKSDYRALYLGTIVMLEEESLRTGRDNDEAICKLRTWIEAKKYKHAMLEKLAVMKSEIKLLLAEEDGELITHEEFVHECMEMLNTFDNKDERIKMAIALDKIVEEEYVRMKNRKRKAKQRELEKEAKGLQVFGDDSYMDI